MVFRALVLSLLSVVAVNQLFLIVLQQRSPDVIITNGAIHATHPEAEPSSTRLTADTVMVDVRRDEIERLLPHALRGARVVPHSSDGRVDGLRLYGVHRGSLWQTLGLRNGDIINSYNGTLPTEGGMLRCLGDCPGSPDHLDMTVSRRGRTVRIVVLIHDA